MEYSWKPKAMIPVDAQVAGDTLEALRIANNDRLTPEMVVDAARDENSPLHPAFEWDDGVAAEAYRASQAGYMIRCIVATVTVDGGEPKTIRAFVNVERDEDRSYTNIVHAMSDAELRAQIVERAWRELLGWKSRYEEYDELAKVVSTIGRENAKRSA